MRPNDWKMNATDDRRSSIRSWSDIAVTSRSPSPHLAAVRAGRGPPTMLSSVVFRTPTGRAVPPAARPARRTRRRAAPRWRCARCRTSDHVRHRQHVRGHRPRHVGSRRSGQTPMWSGSASSRTRSRMPRSSVISRGSCRRQARSSTAALHRVVRDLAVVAGGRAPVDLGAGPAVPGSRRRRRTTVDTAGSCVTISTVTPSSVFARCSAPNTSAAVARVQLAGGLVGEQHLRLVDQRGRDGRALLLAAGRSGPADGPGSRPGRAGRGKSAERAWRFAFPPARQPHRQLDVLLRGQVRQQVARRSAAR